MKDVVKIHEEVYDLLMNYRETQPSCRFAFRRSNRSNRLEEGYWFYGTERYLDVSFWTGMDWKNKTPNIVFAIIVATGETFLEISTSDSDIKRRFVVQHLVDALQMEARGQRFRRSYLNWSDNYLSSLANFLDTDKVLIDDIIRENSASFFTSSEEMIGFIPEEDFTVQLEKINTYRKKLNGKPHENTPGQSDKPQRIARLSIENFGPIKNVEIDDIPFSAQWIFFTGENGTGKTSILRALATVLCFRRLNEGEITQDLPFRARFSLYDRIGTRIDFERVENETTERRDLLSSGFASYGQSRLRTGQPAESSASILFLRESLYDSLFKNDLPLIDLQSQFDNWQKDPLLLSAYEQRKSYITEILTDILPNLYNINFDDEKGGVKVTSYIEKDHEDGQFRKVTFDQLASGLKSMIAMIGDIIARLYNQQPEAFDPSEFTGIVLIDEIDIHLHPKLQKQLVEQLTKTFPKIQFIASTHSPISLLGAPKNSRIFKVERNAMEGVTVQRLDDKLILGDLLPNTILTSPIFGLEDIIPVSHDAGSQMRTETSYTEIEVNNEVKRKINEFLTDEKEQQLIDLFKSRRV